MNLKQNFKSDHVKWVRAISQRATLRQTWKERVATRTKCMNDVFRAFPRQVEASGNKYLPNSFVVNFSKPNFMCMFFRCNSLILPSIIGHVAKLPEKLHHKDSFTQNYERIPFPGCIVVGSRAFKGKPTVIYFRLRLQQSKAVNIYVDFLSSLSFLSVKRRERYCSTVSSRNATVTISLKRSLEKLSLAEAF